MSARRVTMTAMAATVPSAVPTPTPMACEGKWRHDQHKSGKNREQVCAHTKIIADSRSITSLQDALSVPSAVADGPRSSEGRTHLLPQAVLTTPPRG
jgi:hypothetical protein